MSSFLQTIRTESPKCLKLSLGVHPTAYTPPKSFPIIAVERRSANRPLSQQVLAGVMEKAVSVIVEIRDFLAG
jgi:hypothetical protein